MTRLTRRRFLTLSATAVALPAFAGNAQAAYWRGTALGAPASMRIEGLTGDAAAPIFAAVEDELARLERIFSLYRPDSQISQLNASGRLAAPAPELLEVLGLSAALHDASGGVFDPTIQPLWLALASGGDDKPARRAVGWSGLRVEPQEVAFAKPGMGLTLNGIAQGAITDRIATLLRVRGLRDVLLDMGEVVALGAGTGGAPWRAGIVDPDRAVRHRITLRDRALATSAPAASLLGADRKQGHILHPRDDLSRRELVSVSAPNAALADGLSTALCLSDNAGTATLLARFPDARIELLL